MRVKVDTVNQIIMSIIMLQEPVTSVIENLDLPIGSARTNAGTIRVELDIADHASVICIGVNELVALHVPQAHRLVITGTCNHSCIKTELCFANPVGVTLEGLEELAFGNRPHLDSLVI